MSTAAAAGHVLVDPAARADVGPGADEGSAAVAGADPGRLRPVDLLRPVGIFLASRAVVLLALWFATRLAPERTLGQYASTWDGGWYLSVASDGYPDAVPAAAASSLAFFPVYPLLVRAVDALPWVTPVGAALLVGGFSGCTGRCGIQHRQMAN